jgi:hypothetical protein
MRDVELLVELLEADDEAAAIKALTKRGLFRDTKHWRYIGDLRNNESVILAQQSSATAALIEKYTNGLDAILLRHCKMKGIDPRGPKAPKTMADAIDVFFGDLEEKGFETIRDIADQNLVLYATGGKARPSLSLYDAGEGQLPADFPTTFCSLISAGDRGAYKGSIPFVQGRFNMGGTGVLQFCSKERKLQLIVSRLPNELAKTKGHEWGYTIMCYFAGEGGQDPSWRYLVDDGGKDVYTAGTAPLALLPRAGVPKGLPAPRERKVTSGTLIKMYDYEAPKSNICGELFKKIEEYLLRPALPLRIIECRKEYTAKVMAVTVWDCMARWAKNGKIEDDFTDGASFELTLDTGETVPGEIRVFKAQDLSDDQDAPHTGLRCLINGQSHGKRDARFFRTRAVDKEHIAGSILVTLFCEKLSQATKNHLFLSNRETLREGAVLDDLLGKLQTELRDHEALIELNQRRYAEKVKDSIKDEDGIKALEELLSTDPQLANLFGTMLPGRVAAPTAGQGTGVTVPGEPLPFKGVDFPTFIHRGKEKQMSADVELPQGDVARVSFATDVKNNYFTRRKPPRGVVSFAGNLNDPSYRLFNGRLTFTCRADKKMPIGTPLATTITITDKRGSGPFLLNINATVVAPREERQPSGRDPRKHESRVPAGPSQPDVIERDLGPSELPAKVEKDPSTKRLKIIINKSSKLLEDAKQLRPKEEEPAVSFVFKYGLALAVMGLLDSAQKTEEWQTDEAGCRERIETMAAGVARVIVPLCLSLPKNLPKGAGKTTPKAKTAVAALG